MIKYETNPHILTDLNLKYLTMNHNDSSHESGDIKARLPQIIKVEQIQNSQSDDTYSNSRTQTNIITLER